MTGDLSFVAGKINEGPTTTTTTTKITGRRVKELTYKLGGISNRIIRADKTRITRAADFGMINLSEEVKVKKDAQPTE